MRVFSERGQSIVEFALVLPIILLLVMGTIDFGMLFLTKSQVEAASEAGAREAALNSSLDAPTLTSYLQNAFPNLNLTAANISSDSTSVAVTVYATYTVLTPVIEPFLGPSISVSSTTSMVKESS